MGGKQTNSIFIGPTHTETQTDSLTHTPSLTDTDTQIHRNTIFIPGIRQLLMPWAKNG